MLRVSQLVPCSKVKQSNLWTVHGVGSNRMVVLTVVLTVALTVALTVVLTVVLTVALTVALTAVVEYGQ